jgi:hypothetical protein
MIFVVSLRYDEYYFSSNTLLGNFGSYAGDALDDAWQFQYFGLSNPLARPLLDPDGERYSALARMISFTMETGMVTGPWVVVRTAPCSVKMSSEPESCPLS